MCLAGVYAQDMGRGQQQRSGISAATLRQGAADLRALKRAGLEAACAEIFQANPQVASVYVELPLSGEVELICGIREGYSLAEGFSVSTEGRLVGLDFAEVVYDPDTARYTHWKVFREEKMAGADKLREIFGEISWADACSWVTGEGNSENEEITMEIPRSGQPKITYQYGKSHAW